MARNPLVSSVAELSSQPSPVLRVRTGLALILLMFILLPVIVPSPSMVRGQGFFRPMQGAQSGRFVEPPRIVQQQLREAERALEEQRDSDAVVRLGDLLSTDYSSRDDSDLSGQDFFLGLDDSRASGVPVTNSLFRKAREMIGDLPADAMEKYELRYGPLARKLLSEAAPSRDWEKVREVRRKYFHTLAGYEASALLAQQELFAGHPLAASILLDDVVVQARAVQHLGKSIVLLHASAARLAKRDLPAINVTAEDEVEVGGEPQPWPADGELSEWLEKRFGRINGFSTGQLEEYAVFGAKPDRNGASSGQMPLTNLRWELDTTASPRQKRTVRNLTEELSTSGKLPPPSWIPLRVGDQLLMRTTERLVGVDYRTGKRVWIYPWQSSYELFDEEESSLDGLSDGSDTNDLLSQRVWNDVPYGQITSDGERAFILDDLREVEMASFSPMINLRGTRPANTGTNTLVALELASEGKLLWRLGEGSEESSTLSDAFFLGPPLPLDNRLYVMAEIAGDINLCCLDPATGEELWRQQLVAVESGGVDADPIRRVAGAVPTYDEGVLICPTGAGAIVAIDLGDRMLRWGVNYDRNREMSISVRGRSRGVEPSQLMQRWFSGAAIAAENSVLVTPIESDRLFGFDLLTGKSLFAEQSRKYKRYLAGIRDGRFFVVGTNQVQAYELRSGKLVWTTEDDMLAAGQQISGFGMFGEDGYYLPTTSNQIVRISLKDGSVTDRRNTRYPLGNLLAVDGEIIAQGPTSLAVAFGETTLEPIVNRMLEQDPDNFEALVRKSELLIQRGDRDQALQLLTKARQMQPDNDEVRMLSVSAMLGKLREDLTADSEIVNTLDGLIDRPSQRVELLSLRIRAALTSGNPQEAAKRLIDLSSLIVSEPLLESSASQVVNDTSRHCSLDSWLAARVREMTLNLDESELSQVNQMIREEIESKQQGSTSLLQRIVRHFGSLPGVDSVRQELAERLSQDGANLELERLALATEIPSMSGLQQLSLQRLEMLAEAYASGGMPRDAVLVLDKLQSRGDAAKSDRLAELRELAESQISLPRWPRSASLQWDSRNARIRPLTFSQRVAKTDVLAGQQFQGWQLVSEGTSPLSLRDPTGQARRIPLEGGRSDDSDKEAQVCGGMMVVVTTSGLIALDLYHLLAGDGEAVLWSRGLSGDSGPATRRRVVTTPFDDQFFRYAIGTGAATAVPPEFKLGPVLGDRVVLLQGGDLMAIDLLSNETLWRNSTAPKSGSVLSDGERVAVVSPATNEIVFFDLFDGHRLDSVNWDHGVVWASAGSHVLSYRETNADPPLEVRLVNPFTGNVLLRHETHGANRSNAAETVPSAYGRVVGGRYLALLDNGGQALLWDLVEGREIGRPQLPEYPDLNGLQVMILSGQTLVPDEQQEGAKSSQQTPVGQIILLPRRSIDQSSHLQTTDPSSHQTAHGVHAISLDDGSLRWGQQFEKPWGCTLTQPAETPILLLTRSPSTYTNSSRRKYLDVLALDVRDGSEINQSLGKPIQSSSNELETQMNVQPGLSRVIAHVGSQILTYTFGKAEDPQQ